ncbi:MAG: hypothetical protein OEM46_06395 [Ignavibacteria bacterium]|nr:hypothetical protein [Ignavibacteria bacterium]
MNKDELIELKTLAIDLNDEKSVNSLSQTLSELKGAGYVKVILEFKTSADQELNKSQIDIESFRKIKEVQELPDWVVINFMIAAEKLKDSNLIKRLSYG